MMVLVGITVPLSFAETIAECKSIVCGVELIPATRDKSNVVLMPVVDTLLNSELFGLCDNHD